jgi:glycosyltransferase involved in cell wall biosynthesis
MLMLVTVLFFRKHYEVIQVNTLPDALVFITIIPHLLGAKVLLDMHEPTPELFITKYGSRKYSMILKLVIFLEQLAIRYADKVITVNSALCKRLIERGADKNRITVIRNLPDESVFRERSNPNKEQGLRLITHGSIEKRYGVDLIIRALPILHLNNKRWHITIVGDGREMENLQHLAEELDCLKHITFTGRVPFPQVVNLINSSDIGIISLPPSPFSELCQPNKLFEYVACKKPVVAPRLRAIEECFDDSCIMFFEPGDYRSLAKAIQILHRNPDMQKTLADNAYHRYEKIKWSKEKQIYLNLVRKLVSV